MTDVIIRYIDYTRSFEEAPPSHPGAFEVPREFWDDYNRTRSAAHKMASMLHYYRHKAFPSKDD